MHIRKKNTPTNVLLVTNFKDINWMSWTTRHNEDSKENKFIKTIRDYLHQHIQEPTRSRGNDAPSSLDFRIFIDDKEISNSSYEKILGVYFDNKLNFKTHK